MTLGACNAGSAPTAPAMHHIYTPWAHARTTHPRAATSTTPSWRLVGRDVLAQWPLLSQSDVADVTGCGLLNVWAMSPAPPAPSNHRQYVAHRSGMLTHTMLLRDIAKPTHVTRDLRREEIHRADLCALMGQTDRFTKADTFYHYDTSERERVRKEMDRLLKYAGDPTDPSIRVVLTGMGGTGKSHNLAYWVSLQRLAGHMVVYVHDMDNWLTGGDAYLFKEITFAICRYKHWGATPTSATMSLDTISEATKNTLWANTKSPTNPKLTLHETLLACVDAIKSCEYDVYTKHPKQVLRDLRALLDALPPVGTFRPKLIFVVDQDNRLNKVLKERATSVGYEIASIVDNVIVTNTAHLTVASASANNEGWDRRDWPKQDSIVQGAHGLREDQADDMMKLLLPASTNLPMEKVLERIRDETECSPIDMRTICREISALTNSAIEIASVEAAIREWKAELMVSFKKYVLDLPERKAEDFASRVLERKPSPYYDRRYMEWRESHLAHPYTYRNPYITGLIITWATVGASKSIVSSSAWYERCCIYALPSLLKSNNTPLSDLWTMSTVFPHFNALSKGNLYGLNVYQCVAMGHHIDAVSVDYKLQGNDTWKCHVGIYQITQNTNSHVDSYAKVSTCKELAQFKDALSKLESQMELDIRFFWIVEKVQDTRLELQNSVALNLTKTERNRSDLWGLSWNFLHDAATVYTAERVENTDNTTGESVMKEYVVEYKNTEFPAPRVVSV